MDRVIIEQNGIRRPSLTKAELQVVFGTKRTDRMLWASRHGDPWLVFFENAKGSPGVTTKVTSTSVEAAVKRIEKGEEPPRMPSERKLTHHPQSGDDDVEKTIQYLIGIAQSLSPRVSKATLDRQHGGVSLQFRDNSFRYCRLSSTKPTQRRRVLSVTFVDNSSAPSPIEEALPAS